nr:YaiO family outer membrane beta-barrel protein [uncultured Albidiferax sp.]
MRVNLVRQAATGLALAMGAGASASEPSLPPITWDMQASHSQLSAGLPDGEALVVRATQALPAGSHLLAELVQERKFGERGGTLALAYTGFLAPDWFATGTLVAGQGGPNWAKWRADLQVSTKWLDQRQLVTSGALYHAVFDGSRSDSGLRLSATWYLPASAVVEAGVTFNLSQPGSVHSHMPYAAVTWGREGQQYLSLRASSGTEAYQALGAAAQLVNFRSRSVAATWRQWIGPQWGITAQAEHYRNPTYQRQTLGLGLFAQW